MTRMYRKNRHWLATTTLAGLLLGGTTLLGGCSSASSGALIGAGVGALAGQAAGHNTKSTLIGTGIGTGVGYMIGNEMDKSHHHKSKSYKYHY